MITMGQFIFNTFNENAPMQRSQAYGFCQKNNVVGCKSKVVNHIHNKQWRF